MGEDLRKFGAGSVGGKRLRLGVATGLPQVDKSIRWGKRKGIFDWEEGEVFLSLLVLSNADVR